MNKLLATLTLGVMLATPMVATTAGADTPRGNLPAAVDQLLADPTYAAHVAAVRAELESYDPMTRIDTVLRDESRTVQPGLLGAREHGVHVVRARIVAQRAERKHDDRHEGEVVGGAQVQLVAVELEPGQVEHSPLPDRERALRVDAAGPERVVREVDGLGVAIEVAGERWRVGVVADRHGAQRRPRQAHHDRLQQRGPGEDALQPAA